MIGRVARRRKARFISLGLIALGLTALMSGLATAQQGPPGNNGTVKVDGRPFDDHPNNEPHPGCTFEIDWYNFDANAVSDVTFETQSPTSRRTLRTDRVVLDGDANDGGDQDGLDGHRAYTLSFTAADHLHPNQGYHVKLTIETTWSNGSDVKHKVFWVSGCSSGGTTTPPPTTTTPLPTTTTPPGTSTTPPTVGGGGGGMTGGPTVGGVSGTTPAELAFTGPEEDAPWLIAATIAFLVAGTLALRLASKPKPADDSN
jgi:hypothetical protein